MFKFFLTVVLIVLFTSNSGAQDTSNITSNANPVSLEYNVLFKADELYDVQMTGYTDEKGFFDGSLIPYYSEAAPTNDTPIIIEINDLPKIRTHRGGFIGWTTRYWGAKRFKIEGYNGVVNDANTGWRTLADYSDVDYDGNSFMTAIDPSPALTKLRYTFYQGTGNQGGRLGISELIFINPEAITPYKNLMKSASPWTENLETVFYNGKVGIGVTDPDQKLEVKLSSNTDLRTFSAGAEVVTNTAGGYARGFRVRNENDDTSVFFGSHGGSAYISASYDAGVYGTGYVNKDLVILGNGDVGIGTSNPDMKLHLGNLDSFDGINFDSFFKMRTSSAGSNHFILEKTALSGNLYLRARSSTSESGNLVLNDLGGNVGIGTINTSTHKLAVEGSIGAREIKVEATGWSDFVFEKEYKLPTLQEVEEHIQDKGHLQDIPSAEDVAENGIFLGEMDSKLLQKIEELMLYTIEQQKQIDQLVKENKEFKEKLGLK